MILDYTGGPNETARVLTGGLRGVRLRGDVTTEAQRERE